MNNPAIIQQQKIILIIRIIKVDYKFTMWFKNGSKKKNLIRFRVTYRLRKKGKRNGNVEGPSGEKSKEE